MNKKGGKIKKDCKKKEIKFTSLAQMLEDRRDWADWTFAGLVNQIKAQHGRLA
jgi:hypothetical protein